tara:strand:+ start:1062 stop:1424 length:363 start_codon:yes stop_codon:yes gene_type:complete
VDMSSSDFDPKILKQVAGTMAEALTEKSQQQAREKKIVEDLTLGVDKAQTVKCDSCGHHIFEKGIVLKRFSAIISPTGDEVVVPVDVFSCIKCGNVNDEFLPSYAISDVKKVDENGLPSY